MTGEAIAIGLALGTAWAVFDVARKTLADRLSTPAVVLVATLGQVPFLLVWIVVDGVPLRAVDDWPWLGGLNIALNIAANLMFIHAVRVSPLAATIPMLSFTPAFSAIVAAEWLGERLAWVAVAGIVAVVAGAFLLNLRSGDLKRPGRIIGSLSRERGTLWMLGVALIWSATPVIDKQLVTGGTPWPVHALLQVSGVGLGLAVLLQGRRRREWRAIRRHWRAAAVTAFAGAVAVGFQLVVLQQMEVGLMEALKRAAELTLTAVLGWLAFRERPSPARIVAIGLMAAGVWLICLP